jgi:hypothetical protein
MNQPMKNQALNPKLIWRQVNPINKITFKKIQSLKAISFIRVASRIGYGKQDPNNNA